MKKGNSTWLAGHLRRAKKVYEAEKKTYESIPPHVQVCNSKIDLFEIFSGAGRLTDMASKYQLNALQPIDLREGIDLKTKEGRDLVWHAVTRHRPLLVHIAWPCTLWSVFNENMNYSWRPDELEALRADERELLRWTADICRFQVQQGRLFLGENVQKSRIWQEPDMEEIAALPDVGISVCDAGAYGAETSDGFPMIKPHRWIGNSPEILSNLQKRLTPEQKLFCKAIEGAETARSGEYGSGLVHAILKGLRAEAQKRNPARFMKKDTHETYYMKPNMDKEAWRSILDELEQRFENAHKRTYDLNRSDPMYLKVAELVPWSLEKVQVASTPAARRFPALKVPFTHRGAALKMSDGSICLETEDLAAVSYPQQRFSSPVRVGLFYFGTAPEESEMSSHEPFPPPPPGEKLWTAQQDGATESMTTRLGGPSWHLATRRMIRDRDTGVILQDLVHPPHQSADWVHFKFSEPKNVETAFYYAPAAASGKSVRKGSSAHPPKKRPATEAEDEQDEFEADDTLDHELDCTPATSKRKTDMCMVT